MSTPQDSRSTHLIDPETRALLDALPPFTLSAETLADFRAMAFPAPPMSATEAAVTIEQRTIPGAEGAPAVPIALYRPESAATVLPVILHIHGGGFVGGSIAANEPRYRSLVAELGCALVAVGYRRAPETAFPGNIEDCYAALAWIHDQADALGVAADRLVVMGESAGGGLAASLALLARDRGAYAIALQHLTYPMLDDRTARDGPPHAYAGEFVWTPEHNLFGWTSLLGTAPGGDDVSPYAAAARAETLAGVAPVFILTGALDLFAEEDLDYARRLMRDGVPVAFHVLPGGTHGFDLMTGAAVGRLARELSRGALSRALWSTPA